MPDSRVDTIIDRLRNARSTGIDHRGEVRVPLAVAVAAVHAAAGLGSPDERLREAAAWLVELAAAAVCEPRRFAENETELQWKTADAITATRAALAAAARDTPDDSPDLGCPDGGTCHHNCGDYAGPPFHCWRVHNAAPLSMYGEAWPTPLPHAVVLPVNEPETNT